MQYLQVVILIVALFNLVGCAKREVKPEQPPKKELPRGEQKSYSYYIHLDGSDDILALASTLYECDLLGYEAKLRAQPHKNDLFIGPFISQKEAIDALYRFKSVNRKFAKLFRIEKEKSTQ